MSRAAARRPSASNSAVAPLNGDYLDQSRLPFSSLIFLLPLIFIYHFASRSTLASDLIAFKLLQQFFNLLGVHGRTLPALVLIASLLSWHIVRHDPWKVRGRVLLGMALESFIWSIPVILISLLCRRYIPMYTGQGTWPNLLVLSLGAGLYEEMVFRLIAFAILNLLLVEILKLSKNWSILLVVLVPAILFAAYHHLGPERFSWPVFAFRTIAGIYFGVLFSLRGFGVTAGCHATYDIVVVSWLAFVHV